MAFSFVLDNSLSGSPMTHSADSPLVISEADLRRIIREEIQRATRLRGGAALPVPDRAQFRATAFLSSLLHDIAEVARAAGIKNPVQRTPRTAFAFLWILLNLTTLLGARAALYSSPPASGTTLALTVFGLLNLNVLCLIVYSLLPGLVSAGVPTASRDRHSTP